MNNILYEKAEADFREGWLGTKDTYTKHHKLLPYRCHCPACTIAHEIHKEIKEPRYASYCIFCPVTAWRNKAKKDNTSTPCVAKGALYIKWAHEENIDRKAKLAERISRLKWSWIPEYQNLD